MVTLQKRLEIRKRPDSLPLLHQDWRDLLFLHWKCEAETIQQLLPAGLFVDTFDHSSYVTLLPFSMKNVRIFPLPALPGLSQFIEVNFRTYVYDRKGIPGIWFFSLDLSSWIVSRFARKTFSLPYLFAPLQKQTPADRIVIAGQRCDSPPGDIHFTYRPIPEKSQYAEPGTLEFFLIERYVLFTETTKGLKLGRVAHEPYPLTRVDCSEWRFPLSHPLFSSLLQHPPVLSHYSSGVDVDIFPLKPA